MEHRNIPKFVYTYIDMGSIAGNYDNENFKIKDNRIFLDVGNHLTKGVIDHHHRLEGEIIGGSVYRSATKLVTAYQNYIIDNVEKDACEVEIVLHKNPDFDCYASAYLTQKLILDGKLPEGYVEFADYADEVDAGKVTIGSENLNELFAVGYSIETIILDELSKEIYKDPMELNTKKERLIRERWFKLFDYTFKWICENKNRRLKGTDIFEKDSEFNDEIKYIRKDYELYRSDKGEKNKCEIVAIKLPRIGEDSGELYEVDGIVFNDIPRCKLHKCWARTDKDSPMGKGYVFTFIPTEVKKELVLENEDDNEINKSCTVYVNKAIISVDPNSGYNLRELARQLEEAEVERENLLFGKKSKNVRNRQSRRPGFYDSWCINDDPWYDGRNFNNTIVDAPRRGSLLKLEEIKDIALNFTVPKVKKSSTTLVIPFSFDYKDYDDIYEKLPCVFNGCDEEYSIIESPFSHNSKEDPSRYFLPYINNYLYRSNNDKTRIKNCSSFKIYGGQRLQLKEKDKIRILHYNSNDCNKDKDIGKINSGRVTIFKYGMGVICLNIEHSINNLKKISDVLSVNQLLTYGHEEIRNCFFKEIGQNIKLNFNISTPLLYTSIIIKSKAFSELQSKEVLYKLCNIKTWDKSFKNSEYINKVLNDLFMDIDQNIVYGFSKSGGALVCIDNKQEDDKFQRYIENQIDYFNSINFEIFLLGLHQRVSLMNFSRLLSEMDGKGRTVDIMRLRGSIMNFITQGWFSQITNNEMGQEIYKRWQKVFECENLYREVLEQVEAVDEYNHAKRTRLFEIVSIMAFPILFVAQILSCGLIKTKTIGPIEGIPWQYTIGGSFVFMIILLLPMVIKKKR